MGYVISLEGKSKFRNSPRSKTLPLFRVFCRPFLKSTNFSKAKNWTNQPKSWRKNSPKMSQCFWGVLLHQKKKYQLPGLETGTLRFPPKKIYKNQLKNWKLSFHPKGDKTRAPRVKTSCFWKVTWPCRLHPPPPLRKPWSGSPIDSRENESQSFGKQEEFQLETHSTKKKKKTVFEREKHSQLETPEFYSCTLQIHIDSQTLSLAYLGEV